VEKINEIFQLSPENLDLVPYIKDPSFIGKKNIYQLMCPKKIIKISSDVITFFQKKFVLQPSQQQLRDRKRK
jgi:hypothetical protein